MNLKDLLIALDHAPHEPRGKDNPYGTGHLLHVGLVIQCQGTQDADGELVPESRHVIGTMTAVPDAGADVVPTERADEATFELTQTSFDLSNPVCTVCGQPVSI